MKAASRTAETPPAIRVRMDAALWDLVHRFPKENWSQVCRSAMERRAKVLAKMKPSNGRTKGSR